MATHKPLVRRSGRSEQLAAGDTLDKSALIEALQLTLTGLQTNDASALTAGTTLIQAMGKLQAQANAKVDKLAEHSLISNAERVRVANAVQRSEVGTAAARNVGTATGDVLVAGVGGLMATPAEGQIRSWVLPQMSMGEVGISDEYLLLFPMDVPGPHRISGSFSTSRGSESTGNVATREFIEAQTAFYSTLCQLSRLTPNGRFPYFSRVLYGGSPRPYLALKVEPEGGSAHNQFVFYGSVIGGDENLFRRVTSADLLVETELYQGVDWIVHSGSMVGPLWKGSWCQIDRTAAGDVYRYADGRMRVVLPPFVGYTADEEVRLTYPTNFYTDLYLVCSVEVTPFDFNDFSRSTYATSSTVSFISSSTSASNVVMIAVEGRWKS